MTALINDSASFKIHVIAHDTRSPGSVQKFGKCTLAGLIYAKRVDQSYLIEGRHIGGSVDQRAALHDDRTLVRQIEALAGGQRPYIARHACFAQNFGQVGETSDARTTG